MEGLHVSQQRRHPAGEVVHLSARSALVARCMCCLATPQALSTQHANKMAGSRAPPLWAVLLIVVLGWNEFMALLWNPVRG
jgi:hypothetical protein